MKCYLMNKNTKTALIELDTEYNNITKIYEIYDKNYLPLNIFNSLSDKSKNPTKELDRWFKGRGIPSWRKDLKNLLKKLNIYSPEELLNKAYGLSLSDQYWIKDINQENLNWKDVNFFTNDFEYKGFLNASLSDSRSAENISLHSPNNTTDGMLQKAWTIENKKRVLVKGTFYSTNQEPINEWIASLMCKKLGIDYCNYTTDIIDGKIVSKCEDFINENEEMIPAYDIFYSEKKKNSVSDFEHYINVLEEHGIVNARKQVSDMFLIDYLMLNFDRHLKNFGVIRNVENLKWEKTTPVFDTGESLECDKDIYQINFVDRAGKFFTNTNKSFSEIIKKIDLSYYDFSSLFGIENEIKNKFKKTQFYTNITDERISKITNGLASRIANVSSLQKKYILEMSKNQENLNKDIENEEFDDYNEEENNNPPSLNNDEDEEEDER